MTRKRKRQQSKRMRELQRTGKRAQTDADRELAELAANAPPGEECFLTLLGCKLPPPDFSELEVEIVGDIPLQAGSHQMNEAKLARLKADQEAKAAPRKKLRRNRVVWGLGERLNRQAKEGRIGSARRRHNNGERMALPR